MVTRAGRIHASFNQTVAATGRLSSSDPNLQNIPIRTPLGREVRKAFIPGERDWVLLSADYSQIELRIMAHLSKDPVLVEAFRRDLDVHRDTAARLFGVAPEAVADRERSLAKTVNFGILYGQGAFGLARTLGIPAGDASEFIKSYRTQYAGVVEYLDQTLREAKKNGFVTTLLNRRQYLPGSSSRRGRAAAAGRLANTPFRARTADLIKVAMVASPAWRGGLEAGCFSRCTTTRLECPKERWNDSNAWCGKPWKARSASTPVVVNVGVCGTGRKSTDAAGGLTGARAAEIDGGRMLVERGFPWSRPIASPTSSMLRVPTLRAILSRDSGGCDAAGQEHRSRRHLAGILADRNCSA
jgi:hypothetical protein